MSRWQPLRPGVILVDDLRSFVDGRPLDIDVVNIHSANPAGVTKMSQALRHWGYRVRIASGSAEVGYVDGPTTQ